MSEKKVILCLNIILNIFLLIYINLRNKISDKLYVIFLSCFLISTFILIIIFFIEGIIEKNSSTKGKAKVLCIIEMISYFTSFFLFHIVNKPILFSFITITLGILSTYYIKSIYETSKDNIIYNFIKASSDFIDLDDIELKELRRIRTQLFVIQFVNLILRNVSLDILKYSMFIAEYLVIVIILIRYFKIIKTFNNDLYKRGIKSLILYVVIHGFLIIILNINLGGILVYFIFSATTLPMSNFIKYLYGIKEIEKIENKDNIKS